MKFSANGINQTIMTLVIFTSGFLNTYKTAKYRKVAGMLFLQEMGSILQVAIL